MALSNKGIITCAVTGAIHTPSMSPYLPVTADEIAEAAIGAAEAGAAIVHLHARDERTGRPDQSPEAFGRFLPRIKQSTKAVVNLTTGGAPYMTVQERVKPAEVFKPEVASLNNGLDEFRAVSDAQPLQELQARLGGASAREFARSRVPQHLQRHRFRGAHAERRWHSV
jgi:uncharacterized protein (DUF849 family)